MSHSKKVNVFINEKEIERVTYLQIRTKAENYKIYTMLNSRPKEIADGMQSYLIVLRCKSGEKKLEFPKVFKLTVQRGENIQIFYNCVTKQNYITDAENGQEEIYAEIESVKCEEVV